jgi:sporulation protein YunB
MELILCKTLNEATAGSLSYGDLVQLQYDKAGKLVAVTTGFETGNLLRSQIVTNMLSELTALEDETISVPVGSLSALTFLSGLGWEIPVRLLGVTNVDSSFDSSLTSRGINQTLHEIDLVVKADLILLLPGGPRSTTVTSRIPMAETVLLGDVPEAYTYFSQFDTPEDAANAYNDYAAGR